MGFPYFTFNGKSSKDYNIFINKLPPIHSISNEVEYLPVPGRSGYLTIDTNRRETIEKTVEFTVYPDDYLETIKKWLRGAGRVSFSNEPDVFYNARAEDVRTYVGATKEKVSQLNFKCQPYGYLKSGDNKIVITTKNTKINNPESESQPYIKVFGNGAVDLTINNAIFKLNIDGYIELDGQLQEAYKGSSPTTIKGVWKDLVLKEGQNNITWSGTVNQIEVIPKWRK